MTADSLPVTLVSPKTGCKPALDKLDEAEYVNGIILSLRMRSHPAPGIAILLQKLIKKVRYHPNNVKILLNWSIPSSLDTCQRAMKLKAKTGKGVFGSA